jgi:hypothetical protein
MIVKGIVNNKANKFDKHAIVVDGGTGLGELWYSSKFEINCQIGDMVEFDSGPEGKKWCSKLKVLSSGNPTMDKEGNAQAAPVAGQTARTPQGGGGSGFLAPKMDRQRMIVRQNALTNAVSFHSDVDSTPDDILETARLFESYTAGDIEAKMMKDKLAERAKAAEEAEKKAREEAAARAAAAPTPEEAPPAALPVADPFDALFDV